MAGAKARKSLSRAVLVLPRLVHQQQPPSVTHKRMTRRSQKRRRLPGTSR